MKVGPDETLAASSATSTTFRWPRALDFRLDELVEAVREAEAADQDPGSSGRPTSRRDVIAALVLTCLSDGPHLRGIVRQYRDATVGDVPLNASGIRDADTGLLDFPSKRPGPITRSHSR